MIALRSDASLAADVRDALQWDSRIDAATVDVTVADRVVTLSGTVRSYVEKIAAERAAHAVPDVLDVVSELVVLPSRSVGLSDSALATAARNALQWDVRVPDQRISLTVSDGRVVLDGAVELVREREDAERAIRALHGVRAVQNRITVAPRTSDPERIRTAIEGALRRHARREADRIEVSVGEGIVTLCGPVDSFAEKRAILGLVSHLPGIRAVRDEMTLRS
jgi:osmotically-inducible protein OsmY